MTLTAAQPRAARRDGKKPVLTRTFLHIPGIGPQREQSYWHDGLLCWDDVLADRDLFDEGPVQSIERAVSESREHLRTGNARWFEERLQPQDLWRLAPDFDDGRIAYLDIETDGSRADSIPLDDNAPGGTTVCAIYDGNEARVFLRNQDIDEIPDYLSKYKVLCTFNGKSFDLPYLEGRFGKDFFAGAHLDLRPITAAVGLRGGLKKIEQQIGIERSAMIRKYTGYDAVKLWAAFKRGRKDALEPLARYNLADTVNLQTLLRVAYNWAVHHDELPFRRFDEIRNGGEEEATDRAISNLMKAVARH